MTDGEAATEKAPPGAARSSWRRVPARYLKDGKQTYCYNLLGLDRTHIRAEQPVPPGEQQLRHLIDPEQFIHFAMAKQ